MPSLMLKLYKSDMSINTDNLSLKSKSAIGSFCDEKKHHIKLSPIADGPFQVTKVGTNNITLNFPQNTKAYLTINVSQVQLYFGP